MKRLIAKRRLRRKCEFCNRTIYKGEVYYKHRTVFTEENKVYGYTSYICPKCKYKREQWHLRFLIFKHDKCTHPKEFIDTVYRYIPGECVKEPDYDYCRLCGTIL